MRGDRRAAGRERWRRTVLLVRVAPLHAVALLVVACAWWAAAMARPVHLPGGPEGGVALGPLAPAVLPLALPGLLRPTWRVERLLAPRAARRLRLHVLGVLAVGAGAQAAGLALGWLAEGSTVRTALAAALGLGVAGRRIEPVAPVLAVALLVAGITVGIPSWLHPVVRVPPTVQIAAVGAVGLGAVSFLRAQTGLPPQRDHRSVRPTR